MPTRGGDGVGEVVDVVERSVAEAAAVTVAVTATVRSVVVGPHVAIVACQCARLEGCGRVGEQLLGRRGNVASVMLDVGCFVCAHLVGVSHKVLVSLPLARAKLRGLGAIGEERPHTPGNACASKEGTPASVAATSGVVGSN